MLPGSRPLILAVALLFGSLHTGTRAEIPGSIAAYFEGDSLREALLRLTPSYDAAVRRLSRTLDESRRFIRAQIIVARDGGALVSVKSYSSAEIAKDTPEPIEQMFFIYGVSGDVADGGLWEGKVYPAGKFEYTAADKTEQSVSALAVSKEWALRAMENPAKREKP